MKILKILAGILVALVVIIVLAAVILPSFIDINKYRDRIEQEVYKSTGRQLHINEDISLSLLPKISVSTGNVVLDNPDGFQPAGTNNGQDVSQDVSQGQFASIDKASVGLKLWPLLSKKVEIEEVLLDGLNVQLIKTSEEENNWTFETSAAEPEVTTETAEEGSASEFIQNLSVERIAVTNAEINYIDAVADTHQKVSDISLNLENFAFDKETGLNLSLKVADQKSDSMNLSLDASTLLTASLQDMFVNLKDTSLNGQFNDMPFKNNISGLNVNLETIEAQLENLQSEVTVNNQPAKLSLDSLNFNSAEQRVDTGKLNVNYADESNDVGLQTDGLQYALTESSVTLKPLEIMADLKANDARVRLNLPEQVLSLQDELITINQLSGTIESGQLPDNGQISLNALNFNQKTQDFSVNGLIASIPELLDFNADITGNASPVKVNVTASSQSKALNTLLKAFNVDLSSINESALRAFNLDLQADYSLDAQQLNIAKLNGAVGDTSVDMDGKITLGDKKAILATLDLGKVNIDQWMNSGATQSASQPSNTESGQAATTDSKTNSGTAGTTNGGNGTAQAQTSPAAMLRDSIIDVNLNIAEIVSQQNQLDVTDSKLKLLSEAGKSSLAARLTAGISHGAIPEKLNLVSNTALSMNDNNITVNEVNIIAKGNTVHYQLNIPAFTINNNPSEISLNNIVARVKQAGQNINMNVGNLTYGINNQLVTLKTVTARGDVQDMQLNANLPFTQMDMGKQKLVTNDLTVDINASEPLGRLSSPVIDVNLKDMSLNNTNIKFEGKDGQLDFKLNPSTADHLSGVLTTTRLNLKGLLNRFNQYPLDAKSSGLTSLDLNAPIDFQNQRLKISNLDATLDGAKLTGNIDANLAAQSYVANLVMDTLDLRKYLPEPANADSQKSQGSQSTGNEPVVPYDAIKGINADANIKIGNLITPKGASFKDTNVTITAKDNRLSVDPVVTSFAGGKINSSMVMNANSETVSLKTNFASLDVGTALSSLDVTDKLSGLGNFSLETLAKGSSMNEIMKSLNGGINLNVKDGALKGINIQKILQTGLSTFNAIKGSDSTSSYDASENTPFTNMSGDWSINNGVLSGNNLSIRSIAFDVSGQGDVNLPAENIDYLLNIAVKDSFNVAGVSFIDKIKGHALPLKISGNMKSPSFRLDLSQVLRSEISNQLTGKLGDELSEEREKLQGKLLDKLGTDLGSELGGLIPGGSLGQSNQNNQNNTNNQNQQQNSNQNNQNNQNNNQNANQSVEEQLKEKAKERIQKEIFNIFK